MTATIRYLRAGTHSTQDVRAYLQRRGVSSSVISRVVAVCQARGVLDDRACARLLADQWARRGWAWAVIAAKLAERGVGEPGRAAAARAVGATGADDEARARELIAHTTRAGRTDAARRRSLRLLAARGFDDALIEQVVTELFGSIPSHAES